MEQHPNEKLIRECYACFARGDLAGMIALCDESMVYKTHGASAISGTFDNATIGVHINLVVKLCKGTLKQTVVDVVANNDHGMSLISNSIDSNGKPVEFRTIHIWRIKNGKLISWDEYPGSEDEFNRAWS